MIKRTFDFIVAFAAIVILSPVFVLVALSVRFTSVGPVLYWSDRIGRENEIFKMPKFRTMRIDTPVLPTHMLSNAQTYLIPVGGFLRKSSLDELPQLWSILRGDMSLVGPRPALFNQQDLMSLRSSLGIESLRPGLTGWAQINGRDELLIPEKVALDAYYLQHQSFVFDFKIIVKTFYKVAKKESVIH